MEHRHRVVTRMPVETLWNEQGDLSATRGRRLRREDVRALVASRPIRFVIANGGLPLRWIPISERFHVWKTDVLPHLTDADEFFLDDYPDGFVYLASEWLDRGDARPIVLLEMHH